MAHWRKCSSCRTDIGFSVTYWVCSVSTCNSKRRGLFFCSVPCWEAHLPTMRHREAYAVEKRSPSAQAWQQQQASEPSSSEPRSAAKSAPRPASAPVRRRVGVAPSNDELSDDNVPREILIVVSKLKKYIRARSGFNTSDTAMPALSEHIRRICDQAIRVAGQDGRKTVMDRDVDEVVRGR